MRHSLYLAPLALIFAFACAWHARPYRAPFDPAALTSSRLLLFDPFVFDAKSGLPAPLPADWQPHLKKALPLIEQKLNASGRPVRLTGQSVDFVQARFTAPDRYTEFQYRRSVAHNLAIQADVDFLILPVIEQVPESLMKDFSRNIGNTFPSCLVTGRAMQIYVIVFNRAGHLLAVSEEFGTYPIFRPGFKRRESLSLDVVEFQDNRCRAIPDDRLKREELFLKIPDAVERVL